MDQLKKVIELFKLYMPNYYKSNKLIVNVFIISSIISVILEAMIAPYFVGRLINNFRKPFKYFLAVFFIYIFIFIIYYVKKHYEANILPDLVIYPRKVLFKSIIDKYKENYKAIKMGSNISKINIMSGYFRIAYASLIIEILPHFIIIILLTLLFLFVNIKLGIILFITSISLFYLIINNWPKTDKLRLEADNYYYNVTDNNLYDIYTSLLNSYINNNSELDKKRIDKDQDHYRTLYNKVYKSSNKLSYLMNFVSIISLISILFYLIKSSINNEKKIVFVIILIYFINSCFTLSKTFPLILPHLISALRTEPYVKSLVIDKKKYSKTKFNGGSVTFQNVSFKYKKNYIFKNLNISIKDKEKVAIVGKSGLGKSTAILILLKLYSYSGNILIDNKNIKNIDVDYLRSRIIYCNQKTILYDLSVIENMRFGNNAPKGYIISILNKYNLMELFNNLPLSIENNSGVLGSNLSGGMQKIVLIVRSILRIKYDNPFVIIFDEPLSALDPLTREKVIKLIMDFCKNKTLIIITHDKEIIPYMDREIDFSEITK
jgi:ATP-binding cassette subfamily C protein